MKVNKRPGKEKKVFFCFWKCVEHKHIAFVTRSTKKNFGVDHKVRKCLTVSFPFKNLIFLIQDWLLVYGFVFADKIRYLINY